MICLDDIRQARADYFKQHNRWPKEVRIHPAISAELVNSVPFRLINLPAQPISGTGLPRVEGMDWYEDMEIPESEGFRFTEA